MNRYASLLLLFISTAALTGCTLGTVTTDPINVVDPQEVRLPPIQGSVYGGHAPLVGAHIYLVQPGTSGYGSVVKGLLTSVAANSYATTKNGSWPTATSGGFATDQFVPSSDASGNPFFGVTSNSAGEYNLTGDYTCKVGLPVIIIGYGGSPSYAGAGPNTFSVSSATEVNNTSSNNFTFTYTTKSTELFYVGEAVTVSGYPSISAGFNNTGTVLSTGLTTTTFSITVPYGQNANLGNGTPSNLTDSTDVASVTAVPTFNPAAVNMAVLGDCPSTGNFSSTGGTIINYVYMNEVSTTAAAYAFAGYINAGATDQTGNDEFHIGSTGTTQGVQGLSNAGITAGLLYDITGGNTSTTYAGEGHIARATTPNGGFGTVPQSTMDTIGNILAACVDSNNTYRAQTGSVSAQCNKLESTAQDNGVVDGSTILTATSSHVAFNIAQAAFNMARFPQGAGTGTTNSSGVETVTANNATTAASYVSALYGIPTGNVPFAPNLSSTPNDFSIPIQWTLGNAATDVEIDAVGNAWAAAGTNGLYKVTPSGVLTEIAVSGGLSTALSAGLAIDTNGYVWASGTSGVYLYAPAAGNVGTIGTNSSDYGGGIALDSTDQQYIASGSDGTYPSNVALVKNNGYGYSVGGNFPVTGGIAFANTAAACTNAIGFVTLDTSNNIWTASSQNSNTFQQPYVCRFNNSGTLLYALQVPSQEEGGSVTGQAGNFSFPRGLATDTGDNAWFTDKNLDALYKVTAGTTTNNTGYIVKKAAGQLSAPSGVAVDGANTIWVSSTGDLGASTGGKPGTGLVQFSDSDAVLTPAYITGATLSSNPATSLGSVSIDPSGNVWATQSTGQGTVASATLLYEYVGLGAPTRTPLVSSKTSAGTPGTRP